MQTSQEIKNVYEDTGYVLDTHTAVASYVCKMWKEEQDNGKKCLIASTASPYKFVKNVMTSIDKKWESYDELSLLERLQEVSGVEMPQAVKDILDAKVLHRMECDADHMKETVEKIL